MRFGIAALVLAPLAWRQSDGRPGWRTLLLYAAMGLCLAGFFGTMFWAAHRSVHCPWRPCSSACRCWRTASAGAGRRTARGQAARHSRARGERGAGLAWAENGGDFSGMQLGFGELGFFFGCVASALYPVLSKWGLANGSLPTQAGLRTFWSLVAGAVLIGLMGAIWERPAALLHMNLLDLLLVTYLGVFSSAMTFFLQQRATSALTPGR